MQSDLRNLLSAQEVHYSQHYRYAGPAADVNEVAALQFHSSQEVTVRIIEAGERGWAGVSSSDALPGRGCAVFIGAAAPLKTPGGADVLEEGRVLCDGGTAAPRANRAPIEEGR